MIGNLACTLALAVVIEIALAVAVLARASSWKESR